MIIPNPATLPRQSQNCGRECKNLVVVFLGRVGTIALPLATIGIAVMLAHCYSLVPFFHVGFAMKKTYIVRLTNDERSTCLTAVKKLKGTSRKVLRAHILLTSRCRRSELERSKHRQCVSLLPAMHRKSTQTTRDRRLRHRLERQKTGSPRIPETFGRQTRNRSPCVASQCPTRRTQRMDASSACSCEEGDFGVRPFEHAYERGV